MATPLPPSWCTTIVICHGRLSKHTQISGDTGQQILCKPAANSSSVHFPVDTPPHGTPTWQWSHDSYTHCDVSCNGC